MNELYKPSNRNSPPVWYKSKVLWFVVGCLVFGRVMSEISENASKPIQTSETVAAIEDVKPMSEAQLAEVVKQMEAEEKLKKAELKSFYKTKAGKIYKKHPEWSIEDCKKLAAGTVWIGMTLDMLKYKRGLPDSANPSDYGSGVQWQWCWHEFTPSCFYDKNNDMIIDSYN